MHVSPCLFVQGRHSHLVPLATLSFTAQCADMRHLLPCRSLPDKDADLLDVCEEVEPTDQRSLLKYVCVPAAQFPVCASLWASARPQHPLSIFPGSGQGIFRLPVPDSSTPCLHLLYRLPPPVYI